MKRMLAVFLTVCLMLAVCSAFAEEATPAQRADNLSVTHHTATIKGQEIAYTATAGTLAMDTALGQYDLFFIAYTKDDANPAERPITFAYNGGPGCASLYVNMGLMGPDQIALDEEGKVSQVPTSIKANENSLLDLTDLVFIDPVGTGFSRAAGDTENQVFWDYETDIQSVGDFIRVYTNRNERWASPKYLAGESYGTVRTAGLCDYLQNKLHMELSGLMMVSSCNNFASVNFMEGNDLPYATALPTYAAIAWYHGKVGAQYLNMTLEAFLEDVRAFADGEYWSALFKGSQLTEAETDALAEKLVVFTGLKKDLILQKNLRIDMNTFCKSLMEDDKLFVGRLDGRYTGPATSGSIEDGDADPSATGVTEAFVTVANDIISRKLKFQSDLFYDSLSDEVNEVWTFKKYHNSFLSQEKILYDCMSRNPYLKVWVICGYYDLATPFHAAEWTYNHLFLNESSRSQLQFTYYKSGHMFYLHEPSYLQFREDAEAWFAK